MFFLLLGLGEEWRSYEPKLTSRGFLKQVNSWGDEELANSSANAHRWWFLGIPGSNEKSVVKLLRTRQSWVFREVPLPTLRNWALSLEYRLECCCELYALVLVFWQATLALSHLRWDRTSWPRHAVVKAAGGDRRTTRLVSNKRTDFSKLSPISLARNARPPSR